MGTLTNDLTSHAQECLEHQREAIAAFRVTGRKTFRAIAMEYGRQWSALRSALQSEAQGQEQEEGEPPALIIDSPPKLLYCSRCHRCNFWPLYDTEQQEQRDIYVDAGGRLVCEDCV